MEDNRFTTRATFTERKPTSDKATGTSPQPPARRATAPVEEPASDERMPRKALTLSPPELTPPGPNASSRQRRHFEEGVAYTHQVSAAITALNRALTEKEESLQALEEKHLERGPRLHLKEIELAGKIALARELLETTQRDIQRRRFQAQQNALTDMRNSELDEQDFKEALALKRARATEAAARAAAAEQVAALKAEAAAFDAETTKLQKQAELEKAQRRVNLATGRRMESEPDEFDDAGDGDPLAFREAMAREEKRQQIVRARDRRLKAVLDTVGGDEAKLSPEQIETMESIKEASVRAERSFDLEGAVGATFPTADEEESQ